MSYKAAPVGFTPACRGFSAICRETSLIDASGLSGSVDSRKPLSHAFWRLKAKQSSFSFTFKHQASFDFKVRVLCNTRTLANGLAETC